MSVACWSFFGSLSATVYSFVEASYTPGILSSYNHREIKVCEGSGAPRNAVCGPVCLWMTGFWLKCGSASGLGHTVMSFRAGNSGIALEAHGGQKNGDMPQKPPKIRRRFLTIYILFILKWLTDISGL